MVSDTLKKPLVQRGPSDFTKLVETKPADDFMFFFLTLKISSLNGRFFGVTCPFEVLKIYLHTYFTSGCLRKLGKGRHEAFWPPAIPKSRRKCCYFEKQCVECTEFIYA